MIVGKLNYDRQYIPYDRFTIFLPPCRALVLSRLIARAMKFLLSDESINSYGFWLLTSGGDLKQFKKNPLMLWMHSRAWRGTTDEVLPLGCWVEITLEDSGIYAEPKFDMNDPFAAKIASKVEQGFIKMASVGIEIIETSRDAKYLKPGQTRETVIKWRLREASIVDIGSNSNALAFYDSDGNILNLSADGGEIDTEKVPVNLLDSQTAEDTTNTDLTMKKVALLFGLAEGATEDDLAAKVTETLAASTAKDGEITTLKAELQALKDADKAKQNAEAVSLVDAAVKDGRIDAKGKESMLKLFGADHEAAKETLAAMPTRTPVRASLADGKDKAEGEREKLEKLSWGELDKGGHLANLKANHNDLYVEKFKAEFGKEPKA